MERFGYLGVQGGNFVDLLATSLVGEKGGHIDVEEKGTGGTPDENRSLDRAGRLWRTMSSFKLRLGDYHAARKSKEGGCGRRTPMAWG